MPTREGHTQTIAAYSERAQEYVAVLGHLKTVWPGTGLDARPHGAIVAQKVTPERGDF